MFNPGKMKGVLAGMPGAAEYEALIGQKDLQPAEWMPNPLPIWLSYYLSF
jgi:hypothetical protein